MSNFQLVKSEWFGSSQCDFWTNGQGEILMTREQIGKSLEYNEPRNSIYKIHERHKERFERFSVVVNLSTTDGKSYDTYLYTAKGIYEICRWSGQPKADQFMAWVWDVIESIRKKELPVPLPVGKENSEDKLINAKVRQAKLLVDMTDKFKNKLPDYAVRKLLNSASEIATGQGVLSQTELIYYEKLKSIIIYKLDMMEQQMGKLTREIINETLHDFTDKYFHQQMDATMYHVFKTELERRMK